MWATVALHVTSAITGKGTLLLPITGWLGRGTHGSFPNGAEGQRKFSVVTAGQVDRPVIVWPSLPCLASTPLPVQHRSMSPTTPTSGIFQPAAISRHVLILEASEGTPPYRASWAFTVVLRLAGEKKPVAAIGLVLPQPSSSGTCVNCVWILVT